MFWMLRKEFFILYKIVGGATVGIGAGLLTYHINKTVEHLNGVVNTKVLEREKRTASYIYLQDSEAKELLQLQFLDKNGVFQPNSFTSAVFLWWRSCKLKYALQLMSIAKCSDCSNRLKAIETLSNCDYLSSADCAHLSQVCNAKVAVGLARSKNVNSKLFSRSLPKRNMSKQVLTEKMRDLLVELNKTKEHPCLTYFLSRAFPGFHNEEGTFFDIDTRGKIRYNAIYDEDVLLKCIKELAHYCSIENNAQELIKTQGLLLVKDVYDHFGDQYAMEFVKLMEQISLWPECLDQLFITGWLKILSEWRNDLDKRISARATHALVNLDADDSFNARYGPQVFLLHPINRTFISKDCVDVVFIHGLLGGALVTWRQREVNLYRLSLYDLQSPQTTSEPPQKKRIMNSSDADTKEYVKTMEDIKEEEWDKVGEDYEFVLTDFPTQMNNFKGCLSLPGNDHLVKKCVEEEDKSEFSSCWPQDWLAKDIPTARILGVNYDTKLTDWQFSCLKETGRNIEAISNSLLTELINVGIGDRPVVWVVHSMGGLLVKSMLIKAWERSGTKFQNFHRNTKGIVFLSTPHFGSQIATMFDSHRVILWPSNEVDDLRVNSTYLKNLHEKFTDWMNEVPQSIITIAETKPTQLSGLGFWVEFLFVLPESADPGFGEIYYLPYDHVNICKPSNRLSFIYKKVLEVVLSTVKK